jgi:D-arabinose 1-dehydrogenase-like Zn-dependent alcohol dehydrogenase
MGWLSLEARRQWIRNQAARHSPACPDEEEARIWAVEGAGGLGHLLAQPLVAAGERVLAMQPSLGARVRLR